MPEEEATLKGSVVPAVPWTLKLMVLEVALTPATVPLSRIMPGVKAPVPWPVKTKPGVKLPAPLPPLATDRVPVKLGMKVKVLAVVVEILIRMLVSELVATWIEGPLIPETAVMAEVK